MGLPIAVGGRLSLSRPLSQNTNDDDKCLIAVGINSDASLSATVTISYGRHSTELEEEETKSAEEEVTEVTVELADLCANQAPHMPPRSTLEKFRIPLLIAAPLPSKSNSHSEADRAQKYPEPTKVNAVVSFSADDRHLVCLIPHLSGVPGGSTVVIFSLRKQLQQTSSNFHLSSDESLDDDIGKHGDINFVPPVACDPRVVLSGGGAAPASLLSSVGPITAICDARGPSGSVLLAGCANGSILAIGYKRSKIAGILYHPVTSGADSRSVSDGKVSAGKVVNGKMSANDMKRKTDTIGQWRRCVVTMVHHSSPVSNDQSYPAAGKNADSFYGRLAVIRADGSVTIYSTSFFKAGMVMNPTPASNSFDASTHSSASSTTSPRANVHADSMDDSSHSNEQEDKSHQIPPMTHVTMNGGTTRKNDSRHNNLTRQINAGDGRSTTRKGGLMLRIEPLSIMEHEVERPRFVHAQWVGWNLLALARGDDRERIHASAKQGEVSQKDVNEGEKDNRCNKEVVAQVWLICTDGSMGLVSELCMNSDRLEEEAHGSFSLLKIHESDDVTGISSPGEEKRNDDNKYAMKTSTISGLHFDSNSRCLAVSGAVDWTRHTSLFDASSNGDTSATGIQLQRETPFVCIWDWSSSVVGFTLCAINDGTHSPPRFSFLFFGHKGRSLFHVYGSNHMVKKEVYGIGVLSPSETASANESMSTVCRVEEASPLFLCPTYVSFPFLSQSNLSSDGSIEWKEALIPNSYISAYGPARISAIGRRMGRSVAIASSRGLCILDLASLRSSSFNKQFHSMGTTDSGKHEIIESKIRPSPCVGATVTLGSKIRSGRNGVRNKRLKWRMFGNESEEKGFRVHSMTWWERDRIQIHGTESENETSEDLLLAVIEPVSGSLNVEYLEEAEKNPKFYLVCWSRRRLGMGEDQLLEEANFMNDESVEHLDDDNLYSRKGILLPDGIFPNSISILAEPNSAVLSFSETTGDKGNELNRAIVLISGASPNSDSVTYAAYQIQTSRGFSRNVRFSQENQILHQSNNNRCVLANLCSYGYIPLYTNCHEDQIFPSSTMSGIFLAGGSFHFDLRIEREVVEDNESEYVATVGIIKMCDGGLDAVCITSSGPTYCGPVLVNNHEGRSYHAANTKPTRDNFFVRTVAKYWVSDVIVNNKKTSSVSLPVSSETNNHDFLIGDFVWTIALTDGSILCWSVPFFSTRHGTTISEHRYQNLIGLPDDIVESKTQESTGMFAGQEHSRSPKWLLRSPSFVFPSHVIASDDSLTNENVSSLCLHLGYVTCVLGDSSIWMSGACTIGHNGLALGPLPSSHFGCVLYAGQRPRKFRHCSSNSDDISPSEIFGIDDCTVNPPAYTASLLSLLLIAASAGSLPTGAEEDESKTSQQQIDASTVAKRNVTLDFAMIARQYAHSLCKSRPYDDSICTAFRVIVLRAIEFLSDSMESSEESNASTNMSSGDNMIVENGDAMPDKVSISNNPFTLARSLLLEVVVAAKESLDPLQFASLFIGIGRQIEPHHFNLLFPLPIPPLDTASFGGNQDDISVSGAEEFLLSEAATDASPVLIDQNMLITVEDLFTISIQYGSFGIAASSLPMFSSKRTSYLKCKELLEQCLEIIGDTNSRIEKKNIDKSIEARVVIQQLFRFGMKLEESGEDGVIMPLPEVASISSASVIANSTSEMMSYEVPRDMASISNSSIGSAEEKDHQADDSTASSGYVQEKYSDTDSNVTTSELEDETIIPAGPKESIFSRLNITHLFFPSDEMNNTLDQEELDEEAINKAAAFFILSGFGEDNVFPADEEKESYLPNGSIFDMIAVSSSPSSNAEENIIMRNNVEEPVVLPSTLPRVDENDTATHISTVAGVVAKYILSETILKYCNDNTYANGWKRASAVAQILVRDMQGSRIIFRSGAVHERILVEQVLDDHSAASTFYASQKDLMRSQYGKTCEEHNGEDNKDVVFFKWHISQCLNQINANSASNIFELALNFLFHHTFHEDVKRMVIPLVMLSVVSGHVSGRISELLGETWDSTSIGKSYSSAARETISQA